MFYWQCPRTLRTTLVSGIFSLRSPPPFLPHHFSFSDSALIAKLIPSFLPQHIHVFVKINPLSHQYWYNPECLVLTYPNLFWLGVLFSYNQMNIFLVSLHLVTSYPVSIFGLKTPCNFIFFFINYSFLYLKLLLRSAPPLPFTITYNVSLLYVLPPLISWVIRTCVSPVCKCTF